MTENETELRFITGDVAELRAIKTAADKKPKGIGGYAAVYNVRSRPIPIDGGRGSFIEIIEPGTFAKALARNPDVLGLLEHDRAMMFGRTKSGTLILSDTPKGLRFDVPKLPKDDIGRRIREGLARGDLDGCSFRFGVPKGGDTWTTERIGGEEVVLHTLTDVTLADVTLTAAPCYPNTSVAMRSLEQWTQGQKKRGKSIQKVILEILTSMKRSDR